MSSTSMVNMFESVCKLYEGERVYMCVCVCGGLLVREKRVRELVQYICIVKGLKVLRWKSSGQEREGSKV
ncbi:hypothetical protein Hanom_Chr13g01232981 [Helianthus anomalus]